MSATAAARFVHVRTDDGECLGCIEVGLYEIVRTVIVEEMSDGSSVGEGIPTPATIDLSLPPEAIR